MGEITERKEGTKMSLSNCPRCGKLFVRTIQPECSDCVNEINRMFEMCREYLRKHRTATVTELSEETGVTVRQITKFIVERRISTDDFPGITYKCEVCGAPIIQNRLCDNCRSRLSDELKQEKRSPDQQSVRKGQAFRSQDRINERFK